jgi:alpha-2-macroglobulin
VRTDANGEASIRVKLPDNLTRYRVMVVAVDDGGSQFGSAEANLTARLPLMVRPSAPRFLNFGDTWNCRSCCKTRPMSR